VNEGQARDNNYFTSEFWRGPEGFMADRQLDLGTFFPFFMYKTRTFIFRSQSFSYAMPEKSSSHSRREDEHSLSLINYLTSERPLAHLSNSQSMTTHFVDDGRIFRTRVTVMRLKS
jgi:hypothetical protein